MSTQTGQTQPTLRQKGFAALYQGHAEPARVFLAAEGMLEAPEAVQAWMLERHYEMARLQEDVARLQDRVNYLEDQLNPPEEPEEYPCQCCGESH